MLKGGQALLVRWPDARHSRDIDLLATGDNGDLDQAVTQLRAAASRDLGDFIRFEHHSTSQERQEREIRKVKFSAYCGTRSAGVVSVDVVTGLQPLGQPKAAKSARGLNTRYRTLRDAEQLADRDGRPPRGPRAA